MLWYAPSNLSPAGDESSRRRCRIASSRSACSSRDGNKPIPSDLVTNPGSGFDPHISPAAAEYQVWTVGEDNRQESASEIRDIIKQCTEQPQFGFLGMRA